MTLLLLKMLRQGKQPPLRRAWMVIDRYEKRTVNFTVRFLGWGWTRGIALALRYRIDCLALSSFGR